MPAAAATAAAAKSVAGIAVRDAERRAVGLVAQLPCLGRGSGCLLWVSCLAWVPTRAGIARVSIDAAATAAAAAAAAAAAVDD